MVDYIGFSYYMFMVVKYDVNIIVENNIVNGGLNYFVENLYIVMSDWGWVIDLDGLRYILNVLYDCYQLLFFIVENGFGVVDEVVDGYIYDDYCIEYLKVYIIVVIEVVD